VNPIHVCIVVDIIPRGSNSQPASVVANISHIRDGPARRYYGSSNEDGVAEGISNVKGLDEVTCSYLRKEGRHSQENEQRPLS